MQAEIVEIDFLPYVASNELLTDRVLHVWRLNLSGEPYERSCDVMSPDEMKRAGRFVFDRDRNRFLRGRYLMRVLLGGYLATDPCALELLTQEHGKPVLDSKYELGFNLSHSGDAGLLAVGRMADIGIDVEMCRLPKDAQDLAKSVFTPLEMNELDTTDANSLTRSFFTGWTRKEAYLKSFGMGLVVEPKSVNVGLAPDRSRVPIVGRSDGAAEVGTILQTDELIASVAVAGGFGRVKFFDARHAAVGALV
jgi:4'-phosphopantetheinyl transferase